MSIKSILTALLSAFMWKPRPITVDHEVAPIVETKEHKEEDCYEIVVQEDGRGKMKKITPERLKEINGKSDWKWLDNVTIAIDPRIGIMGEEEWKIEIEKAKQESPE